MAFSNRVRLPFKITRPQFPEERNVFRKANGAVKVLSATVRKTYEGETDFFPEKWHQRLKIALAHDTVLYEGEKYAGAITADGEYTISWPPMDYPTGKAEFGVQVTPFDATNSNCRSLEEVTQVVLQDDDLGTLEEGTTHSYNVADNDSICCFPALFEIMSYNSDYVNGTPTISNLGELNFTLKAPLIAANGLKLFTYRVTCPNGGYDEADVYANIDGSEEGCLAPTNLQNVGSTPTSLSYTWSAPASIPVGGYGWDIRTQAAPGVVLQSGTVGVLTKTVTGLVANTAYIFNVWSICAEEISNVISILASTIPVSTNCGSYQITFNDGTGIPGNSTSVTIRECSGNVRNRLMFNMTSLIVCAQETAPGAPVQIVGGAGVNITYLGECGTGAVGDQIFILVAPTEGGVCGGGIQAAYLNPAYGGVITTGAVLYINPSMTAPVVGYSFVADSMSGIIFILNSATGVVGTPTGNTC